MTTAGYKRFAHFIRRHYATVTSTLALVVALTGATAMATGVIVTSKQIRNGTILSQDIHSNGVQSSDVRNGTIASADIGNGDVTPTDVTMPAPAQIEQPTGAVATVEAPQSGAYILADKVGTYAKESAESVLEVDWTGTAAAGFASCDFQLRVDGQPSSGSGGEVFVSTGAAGQSVSASALFPGLPAGTHMVEIWAAHPGGAGLAYPCTVGPGGTGINQTFIVSEQVV